MAFSGNFIIAILAGVLVFTSGQFILKVFIETSIHLRSVVGEICSFTLQNHAEISNASESPELSEKAKELAAKLVSSAHSILLYPIAKWLFRLPHKNSIFDSARSLNGISACLRSEGKQGIRDVDWIQKVNEEKDKIGKMLNIPTSYISK